MPATKMSSEHLGKETGRQAPELIVDGLNFQESRILQDSLCSDFRKELIQLTQPSYQYTVNHIKNVGNCICLKYSKSDDGTPHQQELLFMAATFDKNQQPADLKQNVESFGNNLLDFKKSVAKHLCIIATSDGNHWVALLLWKQGNKPLLLYFDPLGKKLSPSLKSMVGKYVRVEVISHVESNNSDDSGVKGTDTGPICLRYFEMVVSELYKPQDFFSSLQQKSRFQVLAEMNLLPCQRSKELLAIKKRFQEMWYQQIVVSNFVKIALNAPCMEFLEFTEELRKCMEKYNSLQEVTQHVVTYLNIAKGLFELEENSSVERHKIQILEAAKLKLDNNQFLTQMIQQGETVIQDMQMRPFEPVDFNDEDLAHLNSKSTYLTTVLTEGFSALYSAACNRNISTEVLQAELHHKLKLTKEISKKLCEFTESKEEKALDDKEVKGLASFLHSLKFLASNTNRSDRSTGTAETKSFEEALTAFLKENQEESNIFSEPTYESTIQKEYVEFRTSKWQNVSLEKIQEWARETRGKLIHPEVPEVIAILDRTRELVSGQRLQNMQIITLMILGSKRSDHGKLCRIQPEEEETTTTAMLAAMKILLGEHYVDIVMMSQLLAEEAFQEHCEFYQLLGITAATNSPKVNENNEGQSKTYYSADIVYGTLNTFKDDYLLDIYGYGRESRGFGTLILDHADPHMIEDAISMTALAATVPALESLQRIYSHIWAALLSVDKTSATEIADELSQQKKELLEADNISPEDAQNVYADLYRRLQMTIYDKIHKDVEHQVNATCMKEVPAHLADLVASCMDTWIDCAMVARYKLKENVDYWLSPGETTNVVILPLEDDRSNFRVITFQHGIRQFLELKHNIQQTTESVAICGISNYGYISLYGSNIFAFTATLGSKAEQDLVQEIYSVDSLRIPTFKTKMFQEIHGRVISDRNWAKYVAVDANLKAIQDGRAVLIICKTIEDCEKVEYCMKVFDTIRPPKPYKEFEEFGSKFRSINVLTNELEKAVSPNVVFPGDAIIATSSIAASLNLTYSKDVDSNGGIHVCLGFCPKTEREKENLFRSARRGDLGSGQIVARMSEIQMSSSPNEAIPGDESNMDFLGDTECESHSFQETVRHVGTGLHRVSNESSDDKMEESRASQQMITEENEIFAAGPGTCTVEPRTDNVMVDNLDGYEAEDENCDENGTNIISELALVDENIAKVSRQPSLVDEQLLERLHQTWDVMAAELDNLDLSTESQKMGYLWDTLLARMTETDRNKLLKCMEIDSKLSSKTQSSKTKSSKSKSSKTKSSKPQPSQPGNGDGSDPKKNSKQDQYLLSLLQEYDSRLLQEYGFKWENWLSKKSAAEKEELTKRVECIDPQCYRSHLWEIDLMTEEVKQRHDQIRAENLQDFASTRDSVERIAQFWTELSTNCVPEHVQLKAILLETDQTVMQNLRAAYQKLHVQEKLFQQFWSFYRGYFSVEQSQHDKCYPSAQDYLDLWATWIYTRDLNSIGDWLDDAESKGGNTRKHWRDELEAAAVNLFNEFKMIVQAKEEEHLQTRRQDSIRSSPLQQGTSLTHSLLSPMNFRHPVPCYEPHYELGVSIRKAILIEVELLGLDILNYHRKPQGSGIASDEMRKIAAGVGALSRSKASVVPAALSDASTVGAFLTTEGIMNITLELLNTEEARNSDSLNDSKCHVVVYIITLLSSEAFEFSLPNVKLLDRAANECLSYAEALKHSQPSSAFCLFLQRLGVQLKRILCALKNNVWNSRFREAIHADVSLPISFQDHRRLVEDCRQRVGTLVMDDAKAILEDSMVKDCKPKIQQCVEQCMQRLKEPRYKLDFVDVDTLISVCLDSFDDDFKSSCQANCEEIMKGIRNCCRKLQIPFQSPNAPEIHHSPRESWVWKSVSKISEIFLSRLESYLKCVQGTEKVVSDSDTMLEYASELLTDKIYDTLQNLKSNPVRAHDLETTFQGRLENDPYDDNAKRSLYNDFLTNSEAVVGKQYVCSATRYDSLMKYQLAYMMDTVRLQRDLEYLNYLKETGSIATIEDLNILTKDLGCCFDIKCSQTGLKRNVGLDIFGTIGLEICKKPGCRRELYRFNHYAEGDASGKDETTETELLLKYICRTLEPESRETKTAEGLWKHLIQFREGRMKKSIDWHMKMQSKFSRLLDGSLQIPQLPVNEDSNVGWSDVEELDIASELVVDDSEAKVGDVQELNSILEGTGNHPHLRGHALAKHSSPTSGLKFIKQNKDVKQLSTFENYESLAEALAACIRKIRNKAEVLPFVRGTDFEIHLDASQLELETPLRMYEIRRENMKPILVKDAFMVNFITLILGSRHTSYSSTDTRRFFHVQTIVPRSERPQDLVQGEPYCIKIRSRASEGYVEGGGRRWKALNRDVSEWKAKYHKP